MFSLRDIVSNIVPFLDTKSIFNLLSTIKDKTILNVFYKIQVSCYIDVENTITAAKTYLCVSNDLNCNKDKLIRVSIRNVLLLVSAPTCLLAFERNICDNDATIHMFPYYNPKQMANLNLRLAIKERIHSGYISLAFINIGYDKTTFSNSNEIVVTGIQRYSLPLHVYMISTEHEAECESSIIILPACIKRVTIIK